MKFLLVSLFLMTACEASHEEVTTEFLLPRELSDCHIFLLQNPSSHLYVMRCPNSTTTTEWNCGKHCRRSLTTIDDEGSER